MNVSSVGGSASLPVPISLPVHPPAGTAAGSTAGATGSPAGGSGSGVGSAAKAPSGSKVATPVAGTAPSVPGGPIAGTPGTPGTPETPGVPTGDLRLPGQHPVKESAEAAARRKEPPKPAPLPPLKGLTVAEIRAMLGVAALPGGTETSQQVASATVQAAVDRYA